LTAKSLELINAAQNIVPDSIAGNEKYSIRVIVVEELFISERNIFGVFAIAVFDGIEVGIEEINEVSIFIDGTVVGVDFGSEVGNDVGFEVELEVGKPDGV
jgi:hypothetical protein